jgi:hypothetical protein
MCGPAIDEMGVSKLIDAPQSLQRRLIDQGDCYRVENHISVNLVPISPDFGLACAHVRAPAERAVLTV